ncbi:Uncharacterised protein [Shigella sonnei]|nr:Uncharacterised protein [Shigella sonnei]
MTVLGHRCGSRQLLRNDLHTDRPVSLNDVTLCQHVECCQSATTCGDTVTVTWQGMNNQILQQADSLNGISQFTDGLRRIRHRAHIQR